VTVEDDSDVTMVTLANVTVDQNSTTAQIHASITNAPIDAPLVLKLSNGATITFDIGKTSAVSTAFELQTSGNNNGRGNGAAFKSYTIGIDQVVSGGDQFEQLDLSDKSRISVGDTYRFNYGDYTSGYQADKTQSIAEKINDGDVFDLGQIFHQMERLDPDLNISDNLKLVKTGNEYALWVDADGAPIPGGATNDLPWTKLVTFELDPNVKVGVDLDSGVIHFGSDVSGLESLPASDSNPV
jgi:hypothetical protein